MGRNPCSLRRGAIWCPVLLCLTLPCFAQNRTPLSCLEMPCLAQSLKTLSGKIESQNGRTIGEAVKVTLQPQDGGPVMTTPVDSDGSFQFTGLWSHIFKLTVKAEGYQTYRKSEDLSGGLTVNYHVLVFMSPLMQRRINPAAEPSLTDMAAPKKARQEFEKARLDWQRHKPKRERKHLENAVKDYPCYARALTVLAALEREEKRFSIAEANYRQAIKCDGTFLRAPHGLASLYLAENKPAESEAILRRDLRVAPNDWVGLYEIGAAHFAMRRYSAAVRDFETAQSFHQQMPPPFYVRLADAYLKTGQNDKALAEVEIYLRLSPEGSYAAGARKMAADLREHGATEAMPPAANQP